MKFITWLRLQLKTAFDRIRNENLKKNALQAIPFWMASVLTGIIAVIYTKLFIAAEDLGTSIYNYHAWLLFVLTPACFILAWWLVKQFAPYARGSGIPQVSAAIQISSPKTIGLVDKLLGVRIMVIKVLSSLVMAFGGGAIGREGPTIQIAASIYKIVYQVLPKWWPKIAKRNMMVTGAAAGLAAVGAAGRPSIHNLPYGLAPTKDIGHWGTHCLGFPGLPSGQTEALVDQISPIR